MAGSKSTQAEKQIILDDIRDKWQNGITRRRDIIEYISKKYKKERAQVDNYIQELNEQLRKEGEFDSEKTRQMLLDRYNELYTLSKDEKDYRTCSMICSKMADIGVMRYETQQIISPQITELIKTLNAIK